VQDELNVYLWKEGFHLFFPMRGTDRWRVIGILPPVLRGRDDLTFDDVVPYVRTEAGTRLAFQECLWFSTYRIQHRCASRFRAGRCFLLGDAAHIHSPMGAQGMNTGLQDAYNLGWKLARVTRGEADATLLDSYEAERLPVAQRLLKTTDRLFMLVVKETWLAALFRTRLSILEKRELNISVKGGYALRAVFDLAAQPPGAPIKIAEIARRQGIPQKFLELILASLKQAGFVESRRGAEGGYLLARSPDSLTVGEVLRHIDGAAQAKGRSRRKGETPFTDMWAQVDQAVSSVIDRTTFADLLRGWQEKQNRYVMNWEI